MPDLDQFLDTLVADVTASTRAPGARHAVARARRRTTVAVAVAGAVALVAVAGGLAAGTSDGRDDPAPVGEPTPPATSPSGTPTAQGSTESPSSAYDLGSQLDAILLEVPGWTVAQGYPEGYDYAFNGPCAGEWMSDATSGSDGGGPPPNGSMAGIGHLGFRSEARASDAVARFVESLRSCTTTAWRVQPIAGSGALLASSATGAAWIQQDGADVTVLQVPTTDGPPPARVRVAVAGWMVAYRTWQEQN